MEKPEETPDESAISDDEEDIPVIIGVEPDQDNTGDRAEQPAERSRRDMATRVGSARLITISEHRTPEESESTESHDEEDGETEAIRVVLDRRGVGSGPLRSRPVDIGDWMRSRNEVLPQQRGRRGYARVSRRPEFKRVDADITELVFSIAEKVGEIVVADDEEEEKEEEE